MTAIVDSFFPLLALILLGWFLRRRSLLGAGAARELTAFVVWLALPSLLFEGISGASWQQLWQPQFVVAYAGAMVATFVLTFCCLPRAVPFADRCLDCFGATYANSGFIGIPLSVLLLGKEALIPATIATLLTAVLLFAVGIVLLELGGGNDGSGTAKSALASVRKAALAVARNPLVVATVAGGLWSATGWAMPQAPHRLFELLAGAAGPCALVSIGALLAQARAGGLDVRVAGAHRHRQAAGAARALRRAGDQGVRAAARVGDDGGAAQRAAHRHRPVHAGRVLPARRGARVAHHVRHDGAVAGERAGVDRAAALIRQRRRGPG